MKTYDQWQRSNKNIYLIFINQNDKYFYKGNCFRHSLINKEAIDWITLVNK